jgi:HEAT repeat protein
LAALLQSIKDPDDDVREEVVFAIGEIGTDAPPTIAALQQALQDPSPTVRGAAQEAIDKLQDEDDEDEPKKGNTPAKKPQNS